MSAPEGAALERLSVVLAEDHGLVRAGLKALLHQLDVTIVGEAETGHDAVDLVARHDPDLVLMDVVMPGLNGIEATFQIRERFPNTRVLIVSLYSNEEYVQRGFAAGASGYLIKDADLEEFKYALNVVASGGTYLSPRIASQMSSRRAGEPVGPARMLAELTPRQREVLQLIAEGHGTRDIASILGISIKTVETHRAQLMRRLDIHDVAGLVRFAIRAGLVALEP